MGKRFLKQAIGFGVLALIVVIVVLVSDAVTPEKTPLINTVTTQTTTKMALNDPGLATGVLANTRIAFTTGEKYQYIWVMNPDGSNQTRLTDTAARCNLIFWSPDGSRISFNSNRDDPDKEDSFKNYVMNADGSNLVEMMPQGWGYGWSPDGLKMVYFGIYEGKTVIFLYCNNSTKVLNDDDIVTDQLAWSPDGTKVAFVSNRDGNLDIYVINADGSGKKRLTKNQGDCGGMTWSPESDKIAFVCRPQGNYHIQQIYIINADGSGLAKLADNSFLPVWSPDGSKIAFIEDAPSYQDGGQICVMNADGSNKMRLTSETGIHYGNLAWSPILK